MWVRALSAAAIALVAASLLSACGGGGGGSSTTAGGGATTPTAPAQTQAPAQTTTSSGGGAATATLAAGRAAFESNGCSSCHTLAAAGATGTVGPDLDRVLPGKSTAFIRQSIVDPNAVIARGYSPNVMPQGFGTQISAGDLSALVAYLHTQAGR